MKKVAVVDYGMGNLRSVTQAVMHVAEGTGVEVVWARTPQEVMDAERVVLPGQGGMRDCMRELHESGMFDAVMHAAAHKPLMGVCVGMQMLLDHSAELDTPCLGLIPGEVVKFDLAGQTQPDGSRYKVPQMGWNQVWQTGETRHPVWGEVPDGAYFYFVHSYHCVAESSAWVAATADYGGPFLAAVARGNVMATQFHPEKSQAAGMQLLRNFLEGRR